MTFSIIAREPETGAFGIAIASRFFAVGSICPFVYPGLGAIVTQALGHPPHGPAGHTLLAEGLAAPAVLEHLLHDDPDREQRQIHLIDDTGRIAGFSGTGNIPAGGLRQADNVSIAGNMLASEHVLDAMLMTYVNENGLGLADRLLAALQAGHEAGGDKRGQQAAALLVYGSQNFPLLSLRVDDSVDALAELARLRQAAETDYIPYMRRFFSPDELRGVLGW